MAKYLSPPTLKSNTTHQIQHTTTTTIKLFKLLRFHKPINSKIINNKTDLRRRVC